MSSAVLPMRKLRPKGLKILPLGLLRTALAPEGLRSNRSAVSPTAYLCLGSERGFLTWGGCALLSQASTGCVWGFGNKG